MAAYVWSRTVNFFLPHIQISYLSAEAIIDFTDNALLEGDADAAIMALYNFFHPLKVTFDADYAIWDGLRSSSPSNTLGVVQLLDELSSTYIRNWDLAIQLVYNIKTTQYKALLPKHRTPFQSGKIASREHALTNLLTAIGTDASLAAVKTSVTSFVALLTAATNKQSGQVTNIDTAIVNLDAAALAAANGLLFVYGGLMTKYYLTPKTIDNFFDVAMLHSVPQTVFNPTLKTTKPKKLSRRKMDTATQSLKFTLEGDNIGHAYYTNGIIKTPTPGAPMIILQPNSIANHSFADGGYSETNHFLYVANTAAGTITIKIEIV